LTHSWVIDWTLAQTISTYNNYYKLNEELKKY
jgi:hypothetical protein